MTKQEQKYLDLIPILQNSHFYPAKIIEVGKKGEKVIGLEINCQPIMKDSKLAAVRAAIGSGFSATWFPNKAVIEIRAAKSAAGGKTAAASVD